MPKPSLILQSFPNRDKMPLEVPQRGRLLANVTGQKFFQIVTLWQAGSCARTAPVAMNGLDPATISVQLPLYEWTCTSDGRSITAGQGHQARDFPLNIKHSLYHDGNILRGFSSVQLTLRDFTFHRPHHVQTLQKTLELSYSQRILLRILLTGAQSAPYHAS